MVPNTSELFPEPETPVKTVSLRFGSSTLTSLRLFSRAPCTRITSWVSASSGWSAVFLGAMPEIVPRHPDDSGRQTFALLDGDRVRRGPHSADDVERLARQE